MPCKIGAFHKKKNTTSILLVVINHNGNIQYITIVMNVKQLLAHQPNNEGFAKIIKVLANALGNYTSLANYNNKSVIYHVYHTSDKLGERSLVLHYFHLEEKDEENYVPFVIQTFTPFPTSIGYKDIDILLSDIHKRLD